MKEEEVKNNNKKRWRYHLANDRERKGNKRKRITNRTEEGRRRKEFKAVVR